MPEMRSKSDKDWRELAAAAARETDPEKLRQIIEELCGALDKRQAQKQLVPRVHVYSEQSIWGDSPVSKEKDHETRKGFDRR